MLSIGSLTRQFLVGLLANAILLVGSVGAIFWATRDAPVAVVGAPVAAAAASKPRNLAPSTSAVPAVAAAPVASFPGTVAPLAVQQSVPPPAARRSGQPRPTLQNGLPPQQHLARISFRGEMLKGFASLQEQVARCSASDASFTLDVETVEGGVRIVDAKLESQGQASEAGVTCARSALRGRVITAPSAEPGKHWQMPFAVASAT